MRFLDLYPLKCVKVQQVAAGRAIEGTYTQNHLCAPGLFGQLLFLLFTCVAEVGTTPHPAKGSVRTRPGLSDGHTPQARKKALFHGLSESIEKVSLFLIDLELQGYEPGVSGGCCISTRRSMPEKEANAEVSRN